MNTKLQLPTGNILVLNSGLDSDQAVVLTGAGKYIKSIKDKGCETCTPLSWETEYSQRTTTVVCESLTGRYISSWSRSSHGSSDGYRSPSNMIGSERSQPVFVKDQYQVTVTFWVAISTNNLGEVVETLPNLDPGSLSYHTGYGDVFEYVLGDRPEPKLPHEKVLNVPRDAFEKRHYFWEEGLKVPGVPAPTNTLVALQKGDKVKHDTLGMGTVKTVMGKTVAIQFEGRGLKILDPKAEPMTHA